MCCLGGRVKLPSVPSPPSELMRLWFEDTFEAKLFRHHSRSVNNASCLSSFVVNERTHDTGISSVIMMGKLTQLIGSLEPEDREQAKHSFTPSTQLLRLPAERAVSTCQLPFQEDRTLL